MVIVIIDILSRIGYSEKKNRGRSPVGGVPLGRRRGTRGKWASLNWSRFSRALRSRGQLHTGFRVYRVRGEREWLAVVPRGSSSSLSFIPPEALLRKGTTIETPGLALFRSSRPISLAEDSESNTPVTDHHRTLTTLVSPRPSAPRDLKHSFSIPLISKDFDGQ